MKTIAVTSQTLSRREGFRDFLQKRFDAVAFNLLDDLRDQNLINFLQPHDYVVLGTEPFHKGIIESCPNLKAVFKYGVGVDNIDFEACKARDLPVYFRKGTNSDAVAEIALSYIIQLLRNQHYSQFMAFNDRWCKTTGKEIGESVVGILGLGCVGSALRRKILGINPSTKVIFNDIKDELFHRPGYVQVEELFKQSDVVSIHIDNTDRANTNFVNDKLLSLMKENACLVNTARGSVLDYRALERNLPSLGGVGLDVFPDEPNIPQFLTQGRSILSCHICGSSETALQNGERFLRDTIIKYT